MKAIKVLFKDAEKVKSLLIKKDLLYKDYFPIKDSKYIYFAVKGPISGFKLIEKKFNKKISFESLFLKKLTKNEFSLLPTSYDTIGDIMILDLPEKLSKKSKIMPSLSIFLIPNKMIPRKMPSCPFHQ